MALKIINNGKFEILGPLTAGANFVTVKDSKGALAGATFPLRATMEQKDTSGIVIKREIVDITNRVDDTFSITRAVEECPLNDTATAMQQVAQSFSDGDALEIRVTGGKFDEIQTDIDSKVSQTEYDAEKSVVLVSAQGDDDYQGNDTSVTAYVNGQTYKVQADVANTGSATLEVNALGPKTLQKTSGGAFVALETNDILANMIFYATYNSTLDVFQFSVDPGQVVITVPSASETVEGIVERATDAEALAGTDTTRYVSPKQLKDYGNKGYTQLLKESGGNGAGSFTTSAFPAKDNLRVLISCKTSGFYNLRFNGDSASNYGYRQVINGTAGSAINGDTGINLISTTDRLQVTVDILNIATKEKTAIISAVNNSTSINAYNIFGRWNNTTNAITTITLNGTGTEDVQITVLGAN